ncbi:MAG: hypothetical protein RSB38_06550 [Oscillospiraceae bacterium]
MIIMGIIIGMLMGLIVVTTMFIDARSKTPVVITMLIGAILGGVIGISSENYFLKEDIDGFSAVKQTYACAVESTDLSGLERLQIVETAIEQNKLLARRKSSINAWWNIVIKSDYKEELKALEPISVD